MNPMKILILADNPTWIVNRCVDNMVACMDEYYFTKKFDQIIDLDDFEKIASNSDIIHFNSWEKLDIYYETVKKIGKCVVLTIRSHRFKPDSVERFVSLCSAVTVVNPQLVNVLANHKARNVVFIPDGIDGKFGENYRPIIGYAGRNDEYKGTKMIEQACQEMELTFRPAYGDNSNMRDYYAGLDCYVCASEAEGFSTGAMEAISMNIPLITADVGVPSHLNVIKVERSVEGIKKGLSMLFAHKQVEKFTWKNVCKQFKAVYDLSFAKESITQDLIHEKSGVKLI